MKTVSLVLVVRNEEKGLQEILPRLPLQKFDDVLAIDGKSKDDTCGPLSRSGIKTYIQKKPGLGAAMLEAREFITDEKRKLRACRCDTRYRNS